jgi:hypothetical protein
MRTKRWNDLTPRQKDAARRFAERFGMTTSQAAKWLDWCFAYRRGEMTALEFVAETGHTPPSADDIQD